MPLERDGSRKASHRLFKAVKNLVLCLYLRPPGLDQVEGDDVAQVVRPEAHTRVSYRCTGVDDVGSFVGMTSWRLFNIPAVMTRFGKRHINLAER